jgi:hypothetical protein
MTKPPGETFSYKAFNASIVDSYRSPSKTQQGQLPGAAQPHFWLGQCKHVILDDHDGGIPLAPESYVKGTNRSTARTVA